MKTKMLFREMVRCIETWDQTIGCANCGRAWWGDNYTPDDPTAFHDDKCPLKGRDDVLAASFDPGVESAHQRKMRLDFSSNVRRRRRWAELDRRWAKKRKRGAK